MEKNNNKKFSNETRKSFKKVSIKTTSRMPRKLTSSLEPPVTSSITLHKIRTSRVNSSENLFNESEIPHSSNNVENRIEEELNLEDIENFRVYESENDQLVQRILETNCDEHLVEEIVSRRSLKTESIPSTDGQFDENDSNSSFYSQQIKKNKIIRDRNNRAQSTKNAVKTPPGRYKVKVYEKPASSKSKAEEEKSPYRCDDFIDFEGNLRKLRGNAFSTYISAEEYRLLKGFNHPGFAVQALPLLPSKQKRTSSLSPSQVQSQPIRLRRLSKVKSISQGTDPIPSQMYYFVEGVESKNQNLHFTTSSNFKPPLSSEVESEAKITATQSTTTETVLFSTSSTQTTEKRVNEENLVKNLTVSTEKIDIEPCLRVDESTNTSTTAIFQTNSEILKLKNVEAIDGSCSSLKNLENTQSSLCIEENIESLQKTNEQQNTENSVLNEKELVKAREIASKKIIDSVLQTHVSIKEAFESFNKSWSKKSSSQRLQNSSGGARQIQNTNSSENSMTDHNGDTEVEDHEKKLKKELLFKILKIYNENLKNISVCLSSSESLKLNTSPKENHNQESLSDFIDCFIENGASIDSSSFFEQLDENIKRSFCYKNGMEEFEISPDLNNLSLTKNGSKTKTSRTSKMSLRSKGSSTSVKFKSFFRYGPEVNEKSLKINLISNFDTNEVSQVIVLPDQSLNYKYNSPDLFGISSIISASRTNSHFLPISSQSLLLILARHASFINMRIVSCKFLISRILIPLNHLVQKFILGKYHDLLLRDSNFCSLTIPAKFYRKLRRINVACGLLYQISSELAVACKKIKWALNQVLSTQMASHNANKTSEDEIFTYLHQRQNGAIPFESILEIHPGFSTILSALEDIKGALKTGQISYDSLSTEKGVKIKEKYTRLISILIQAAHQLEIGREFDFGALILGLFADTVLLYELNGNETSNNELSLSSQQKAKVFDIYTELFHLFQDLTKFTKKVSLLSSFLCCRTMHELQRFRKHQNHWLPLRMYEIMSSRALRGIFKIKKGESELEDKVGFEKIPDDYEEGEGKRFRQMLDAISRNESSISSNIF